MHVHGTPTVPQQGPAAPTAKPARPVPAGVDLHALAALSKDRGGSGSQPHRRDARQVPATPQAAQGPAALLATLLVTLDLDARADDDAGTAAPAPVAPAEAPDTSLAALLRAGG